MRVDRALRGHAFCEAMLYLKSKSVFVKYLNQRVIDESVNGKNLWKCWVFKIQNWVFTII